MDPVEDFLREQAMAGSWPGAAWCVEESGGTVSSGAVGALSREPGASPARLDTIYDLASLTKPLATAALLALLDAEGSVPLSAPAGSILRGLACDRGGRPTLMDLAVHRSGLPAWRPFYARARTPQEVLRAVMDLEPEAPCGERVVYSDAGYILLGEALRSVLGRGLDAVFSGRIARPLGLGTVGFLPHASLRERIAPTEAGNRYERALALNTIEPAPSSNVPGRAAPSTEPGFASGPVEEAGAGDLLVTREVIPPGEVHDGNAHALGGVAGHAGLFGSAPEVARLAREFLGAGTGLFPAHALALFRENATPGLEEGRTLGWKLAVAGAREAEGALPPESFGHTGFTGTSVWLEPVRGRIYVLLTNRVHPEVKPIDMNRLRWRFHDIASKLS